MTDPSPDPTDGQTDGPTDEAFTADPRWGDLDADPALATAVLEIEQHLATNGWDQPARLYALVDTASLVKQEPALAAAMGLDSDAERGSLTAVEQEQLDHATPLEQVLESILWPSAVTGVAAMVERLVLPPGVEADVPDDLDAAQAYAREHPDRQEVRIVAAVTRTGSSYCAMRLRAHDDDTSVVGGLDLVPGLLDLLRATLTDDDTPDIHDIHDTDTPTTHDEEDETP